MDQDGGRVTERKDRDGKEEGTNDKAKEQMIQRGWVRVGEGGEQLSSRS